MFAVKWSKIKNNWNEIIWRKMSKIQKFRVKMFVIEMSNIKNIILGLNTNVKKQVVTNENENIANEKCYR